MEKWAHSYGRKVVATLFVERYLELEVGFHLDVQEHNRLLDAFATSDPYSSTKILEKFIVDVCVSMMWP